VSLTSFVKKNIPNRIRAKQLTAEKTKESQTREKLRKKVINLQKCKLQEKHHFFKRKQKLRIDIVP
jgi:hypothetical protein